MSLDGTFLTEDSGDIKEEAAIDVSAGAGDASKILKTDAGGKIDITFMPDGIGGNSFSLPTFENLSAGDFVYYFDDGGTVKLAKADATTVGKPVIGYVKLSSTAPAVNTIHLEGTNDALAGLTEGVQYWLSTTAGGVTDTSPSASGNIVQKIGVSSSDTEIPFEAAQFIIKA